MALRSIGALRRAALGALLTIIYMAGLVFGPARQHARLGIDSIAVLATYLVALAGLAVERVMVDGATWYWSITNRAGADTALTGTVPLPPGQPVGGAALATTAVGTDVALVAPVLSVAVTLIRRVTPASAFVRTYVLA